MSDRYDSIEFDTIEYLATSGGLGTADSDARMVYYGSNGMPHVLFNGGNIMVGAGTDVIDGHVYDPLVQAMMAEASPLKLSIESFSFANPGAFVTVNLSLEGDLAHVDGNQLRVAILEDDLLYSGVTYHNVLRDMLPDQALTINQAGQSQQITLNFTTDAAWNLSNVRFLAFVQDDSDKDVIQSCNSRIAPDYSMRYYAMGVRDVVGDGVITFDQSALFNTGLLADTYEISLDTSGLPSAWSASFEYDGSAYSNLSLALDPEARALFHVSIDAANTGTGQITLTFHSQSGQTTDRSVIYQVITNDIQILLVNDDGGSGFGSSYFEPAIASSGKGFATMDRSSGILTVDVLSNFDLVIWQCGWTFPTVDADDRAALSAYLDNGGALFITGQDIGWEMYDNGGAARTWYNNYLHADYVADDTNMLSLSGVENDPISHGLSLSIAGGDGADNQEYPSDIDPADASASVILTYDSNRNGGIKVDTGTYKVVYLSFGYEAINNAADRTSLMQGIIGWLLPTVSAVGEGTPAVVALQGNVPNPFNPITEIRFSIGVDSHVKLGIYNVKGQLLRRLENSFRTAGEYNVMWDGNDDAGHALSSGTYFARIESAGHSESLKMMLVK